MVRFISLCVVALLILAGSYYWLKPSSPQLQKQNTDSAEATTMNFSIEIANGNISGDTLMTVSVNQKIALQLRSDKKDEAHLHGYDLSRHLPAGEAQTLQFTASKAGRFTIELHESHREIAVLVVQPNISH